MVVHTNGFHPVTLYFCECDQVRQAGTRVEQLLRAKLYPATIGDPTTSFTFAVLEHFHLLTLQSKTTAYDFYRTLQFITDNAGVGAAKTVSPQFHHVQNIGFYTLLIFYRIGSSRSCG